MANNLETFVLNTLPKSLRRHYVKAEELPSAGHCDVDDDVQTYRVDLDDSQRVDIWRWLPLDVPVSFGNQRIDHMWVLEGSEVLEDEEDTAACKTA